jgi:S-formylglutathione hydrolase
MYPLRTEAAMTSRVSSLLACAGLLASVLSISERPQAAGSGTVEKITVHGRALEGNLEGDSADCDVMVYLPPSYKTEPNRPFPLCIGARRCSHGGSPTRR